MPRRRDAPDVYVVRLAIIEKISHFFAGHHDGRRTTNFTRLDTVAQSLGEIDLNLDFRHFGLELDVQIDDAGNTFESGLDLVGFFMDALQIGAVNPDRK